MSCCIKFQSAIDDGLFDTKNNIIMKESFNDGEGFCDKEIQYYPMKWCPFCGGQLD